MRIGYEIGYITESNAQEWWVEYLEISNNNLNWTRAYSNYSSLDPYQISRKRSFIKSLWRD